jgi:hypothetical protein
MTDNPAGPETAPPTARHRPTTAHRPARRWLAIGAPTAVLLIGAVWLSITGYLAQQAMTKAKADVSRLTS